MSLAGLELFELLHTDPHAGTINFKNRRLLVLDAEVLGLLRRELVQGLGSERARRLLTRFGFAQGYRDALTLKELIAWQSDEDWLAAGPRMQSLKGVVGSRLVRCRIDRNNGIFEAETEWHNSSEAERHRQHFGASREPVCWTLTGYASGYGTAVFGAPVFFVETACAGRGDGPCRVIGRAEGRMDERMRRQVEYFRGETFGADVRRLLAEQAAQATELRRLRTEVRALRSQVLAAGGAGERFGEPPIVGVSRAFREVLAQAERVAASDVAVLLCGETGTGKELLARRIHARSARRGRPLVTVNCAALPASLVENELFGHERGAFTGATRRSLGRFELADGGTLFLDETAALPLETQAKLLRALQYGTVERLGGTCTLTVNVRVVAATNQQLEQLVAEGKFRADLFYRLNVFPLTIPPLRERPEDILPLAEHFVEQFRARFRKPALTIHPLSAGRLLGYSWPGNVRELEHVIERAVLLAEGGVLTVDVPAADRSPPSTRAATPEPERLRSLAEMEREYIERVLRSTGGIIEGRNGAAAILRVNPSTLRSRLKKLGIRAASLVPKLGTAKS